MKILTFFAICATGLLLMTGCKTQSASACNGGCCSDHTMCAKCCGNAAGCAKCCKSKM